MHDAASPKIDREKVFGTLSRSWDAFDAYLFDIDGTLLHCADRVHYNAFCDALQQIAGRPLTLAGVTLHGNTDIGILRDALELAHIPERTWRYRLAEIRDTMCQFVRARQAELRPNALPQVRRVLEYLRSRGARLGVATGNFEDIGRMKLDRAGLLEMFDFGGWSDQFESRVDILRAAAATARARTNAEATICVVGDTPADIRAARENGLSVIAVATGIYSFDQLATVAPDLCLHSFEDLGLTA